MMQMLILKSSVLSLRYNFYYTEAFAILNFVQLACEVICVIYMQWCLLLMFQIIIIFEGLLLCLKYGPYFYRDISFQVATSSSMNF